MKVEFKPEELIERRSKDGKITKYPVVGARLRIAHEENEQVSIITDLIEFKPMVQASVKATVTIKKGVYSAYGCASVEKDGLLKDTLLELAETRSIARALRFAGCGVEYTGVKEIPSVPEKAKSQRAKPNSVKRDDSSAKCFKCGQYFVETKNGVYDSTFRPAA